jgi:hypothetical protein
MKEDDDVVVILFCYEETRRNFQISESIDRMNRMNQSIRGYHQNQKGITTPPLKSKKHFEPSYRSYLLLFDLCIPYFYRR